MYRYDSLDRQVVDERVAQFRDQTRRHLAGELSDDDFRPLRLQNGLYIQRHGPMLRVAIPYGVLLSAQLRRLASIARRHDRGYGHFTTRQNLQLNHVSLESVPGILEELAEVEMHAIQTSGNCIRNVTTDHFAGVAPDEHVDPRALAEILRQWSTLHPEFAHLPRKFKIAFNGADTDRAATLLHDLGFWAVRNSRGELGLKVIVGGGMGRTPIVGHVIREFLPWQEMLNYTEAVLRVYNLHGRRDNLYKARIKILVKALGAGEFARQVEAEWQHLRGSDATIPEHELARVSAFFADPPYESLSDDDHAYEKALADSRVFSLWAGRSVHPHKRPGYAAVTLSLKPHGRPPGDVTAEQMDAVADFAEHYSFGELRVTHEQNLVLTDVRKRDLHALWLAAREAGLATPNRGLLTNIVCCPGGDFCSLANAKSIPVSQAIQERFDDLDWLHDIGELDLNISGCMNSCGHHHVGHIGILGVDKHGSEWYQVSIGGRQGKDAALGDVIGPSFAADDIEVIPGVTSALAASASLAVSLTCRGLSRHVAFVTPRIGAGEDASDWVKVAVAADTVALYMASRQAPAIAKALIEAGRDPRTPIRMVENASLPGERVIATSLGRMLSNVPPSFDGPAVMLVGEVFREVAAARDADRWTPGARSGSIAAQAGLSLAG